MSANLEQTITQQAERIAELEDFCISQGNELAKLDEKVFDQDRLLKQQAEKISATLVALADLPDGALDGGWTYAGMNKYTLGLEADRDALAMQNQQLREALELAAKTISDLETSGDLDTETIPTLMEALALPGASEIIKRHDAAVIRGVMADIQDGSFLHDQAPPKLFANEVCKMLERKASKLEKS